MKCAKSKVFCENCEDSSWCEIYNRLIFFEDANLKIMKVISKKGR